MTAKDIAVDGWYWFRSQEDGWGVVQILNRGNPMSLRVYFPGGESADISSFGEDVEFVGPLTAPGP